MYTTDDIPGYAGVKRGKHFKGPIASPRGTSGAVFVVSLADGNIINVSCSSSGGPPLTDYGPYSRDKGRYVAIEADCDYGEINATKDVYVISYDEDSQDMWTGWTYLPAADNIGFIGKEFVMGDVGYAPTVGSDAVVFDGGDPEFSVIPLYDNTNVTLYSCDTGTVIISSIVNRGGELNYNAHNVNQNGICITASNDSQLLFGTGYAFGQLEAYFPAEKGTENITINVSSAEGIANLLVLASSIRFNNSDVFEGDIVLITATVNNTGVRNATYFRVRAYLNGIENGTLIEEKTVKIIEPASYVDVNFTLDTTGISGNNTITIWVDPQDFIQSYPDDNKASTVLEVKADVDLLLYSEDIFFDNKAPSDGDIVNITAQIRNVGVLSNATNVRVKFFDGDPGNDPNSPLSNQIGTDQIIPLIENGSAANASVLWDTTGYSGYNNIYVWIDPFDTVSEGNENNNKNYTTIAVDPPELEITASDINFNETAPKDGTVVLINATVRNTGLNYAYNVVVNFYEGNPASGGAFIGSDTISSIENNSAGYATVTWNTTGKAGNNEIYVSVDPANSIPEQNEGNNNASTIYFVRTSAFRWWNKSWTYRIPIKIDKDGSGTENIVKVTINFTDELRILGDAAPFDNNSIRIIEYNTTTGSVLTDKGGKGYSYSYQESSSYDAATNAVVTLEWMIDGKINDGEVKYFYIYFDTTDNPKSKVTFSDRINLFWGKKFLAQTPASNTIFIIAKNGTKVNITNSTSTLSVTVGSGTNPGVYRYPYGSGTSDNPDPLTIEAEYDILVYVKSSADDKLYMPPADNNMTEFYGICTAYMNIFNNGTGTASVNGTDIAWSGDTDTDDTFSTTIGQGQIAQITCEGYDFFKIVSNETIVIFGGSDEAGSGETKSAMYTTSDVNGYVGVKKGKYFRGPIASPFNTDGGVVLVSLEDGNSISIACSKNGGTLSNYGPFSLDKGRRAGIEANCDYAEITSTKDMYAISYDEDTQDLWTGWVYLPSLDHKGFIGKEFVVPDVGGTPLVNIDGEPSIYDGGNPSFSVIALRDNTFINITACDTGATISSGIYNRGSELKQDNSDVNIGGFCINATKNVQVLFGTGYATGQLEAYVPAEKEPLDSSEIEQSRAEKIPFVNVSIVSSPSGSVIRTENMDFKGYANNTGTIDASSVWLN